MIIAFRKNSYEDYTETEIEELKALGLTSKSWNRWEVFHADIKDVIKLSFPVTLEKHDVELRYLVDIADKLEMLVTRTTQRTAVELDGESLAALRDYNAKVHVHVPGFGLLMLNEVDMEYDCCTDVLQDRLNKGWRIIAACPQPDKRRPDYILGRARGTAEKD